VTADCDPKRMGEEGHKAFNPLAKQLEAVPSDIVCFEPRADDSRGFHAPVMTNDVTVTHRPPPLPLVPRLHADAHPTRSAYVHGHMSICADDCTHTPLPREATWSHRPRIVCVRRAPSRQTRSFASKPFTRRASGWALAVCALISASSSSWSRTEAVRRRAGAKANRWPCGS
jgi:hypothetical protein